MVMVGLSMMGFTLVIADLNRTARIETWPISWHTSALTTELLVASDQNTDPQVTGSNPFIGIPDLTMDPALQQVDT